MVSFTRVAALCAGIAFAVATPIDQANVVVEKRAAWLSPFKNAIFGGGANANLNANVNTNTHVLSNNPISQSNTCNDNSLTLCCSADGSTGNTSRT
jgi:hypothetical protein